MALDPLHIGAWRREITVLNVNYATRFRRLWAPKQVPGAASVLGSRIHAIYATSNDNAANTLNFAWGKVLTRVGTTPTGLCSFTGGNAIVRSTGSFIADGWMAGERLVVVDPTTLANQVTATVTGVTATQLSFAGSTFGSNEAIPEGAVLVKLGQTGYVPIATNSGYSTSVLPENMLQPANFPWLAGRPDTNEVCGADDILLVACVNALTAGENIEVTAIGGDY